MKCPKCGYLGFETGDRCRHCGYDFSLSPSTTPSRELPLQSGAGAGSPLADFDLDRLDAGRPVPEPTPSLDFDRLIGEPEPEAVLADMSPVRRPAGAPSAGDGTRATAAARVAPPPDESSDRLPLFDSAHAIVDDTPLITTPRPLRPPLAVRRATPEVPRARARTTRPWRSEAPALDLSLEPDESPGGGHAADWAREFEPAPRGARLAAAGIDLALLAAIGLAVIYLTLRILNLTFADAGVLPIVPLAAFLVVLDGGYVATFTAAGGQTIGKMAVGIRVIGDDGRSVDAAGAVLRALGCGLSLATLGLGYLPGLLASDGRTLQDRLAGTRVIRA